MPKQGLGQASSLLVLFFKLFKSWKVVLAVTSLAAYSFLFTWQFAIAIMYAIGVHEMGHVWAMRRVQTNVAHQMIEQVIQNDSILVL